MRNSSKRVLKNTFFLYFRMIFVMLITLYVSRIVLDKLGIVDYGINNIVGGLVTMFAFINNALSGATQRSLNYELGKSNIIGARKVFNQHLILYLTILAIVVLISETVGLWFVKNKLNIPGGRMYAALWVYQFTILSLCVTLVGIIYNSAVIAHEDMQVYSYIGIIDGVSRLGVAYMISTVSYDRLIVYSGLLFIVTLLIQVFYYLYCIRHYSECRIHMQWNRSSFKETGKFIGLNCIDAGIYSFNSQGINILLNIFFGPMVNAARGISVQVNSALTNFSNNFYSSVRPQLFKSYSNGDLNYMKKLFFISSKYTAYLYLMVALPVVLNINPILKLWLVKVPEHTSVFTLWVLVYSFVNVLINPIRSIILATGDLNEYVKWGGSFSLLQLPLIYIALYLGMESEFAFIISVFIRALYLCLIIKISMKFKIYTIIEYMKEVIRPVFMVTLISCIISTLICHKANSLFHHDIYEIIGKTAVTLTITIVSIWLNGMTSAEKSKMHNIVKKVILKGIGHE